MNPLFERLMRQATRLTRGGNLQEATRAIQRALGGAAAEPAAARPADAHRHRPALPTTTRWSSTSRRASSNGRPPKRRHAVAPMRREPGRSSGSTASSPTSTGSIAYKLFVPAKGAGTSASAAA